MVARKPSLHFEVAAFFMSEIHFILSLLVVILFRLYGKVISIYNIGEFDKAKNMELVTGFEPATPSLRMKCSTN